MNDVPGPLLVTMPALSWPRCCKREKAVIGQDGGVGVTEHPEKTAFVLRKGIRLRGLYRSVMFSGEITPNNPLN